MALFESQQRWCQSAEARDEHGEPVRHDDTDAVAWDLTGGMCRLFGWGRACELFPQVDRHLRGAHSSGGTRPAIASMVALQEFNDQQDMTFERLVDRLKTIPVWRGRANSTTSA